MTTTKGPTSGPPIISNFSGASAGIDIGPVMDALKFYDTAKDKEDARVIFDKAAQERAAVDKRRTKELFEYHMLLWSIMNNSARYEKNPKQFDKDAKKLTDELKKDPDPPLEAMTVKLKDFATNPQNPDRALPIEQFVPIYTAGLDLNGPSLLSPRLLDALKRDNKPPRNPLPGDPQQWTLSEKVAYTMLMAKKYGLDGNLLANQLEQESSFNNKAGSGAGCRGVAQFSVATGKMYGLIKDEKTGRDDFIDPQKSIEAAAHHMSDLTKKFGGSQMLALAASNGGPGAVLSVQHALGEGEMTISKWMNYMAEQRKEHGVGNFKNWRNQTFDYIKSIAPAFWSLDTQHAAEKKMANLTGSFEAVRNNSPPNVKMAEHFDPAILTPRA